MDMLKALFRLSLTQPRAGMRLLLNLTPSPGTAMAALAFVAVASALLIHFSLLALSAEGRDFARQIFGSPFYTAAIQALALLVAALLIWQVGRWRQGQGDFTGSVLVMAWLQAIMLVLQLGQILLTLALPPLANLFGYLAFAYFFWLVSHFIAELHRFDSVGKTFLGIVLTLVVAVLILSFLLSLFLSPEALSHGL